MRRFLRLICQAEALAIGMAVVAVKIKGVECNSTVQKARGACIVFGN